MASSSSHHSGTLGRAGNQFLQPTPDLLDAFFGEGAGKGGLGVLSFEVKAARPGQSVHLAYG